MVSYIKGGMQAKGIPILSRINPIPHIAIYFLNIYIQILPSYLCLGHPISLFPVHLPVKGLKTLSSSILATCPAQINLLDSIFLSILEDYTNYVFSRCPNRARD